MRASTVCCLALTACNPGPEPTHPAPLPPPARMAMMAPAPPDEAEPSATVAAPPHAPMSTVRMPTSWQGDETQPFEQRGQAAEQSRRPTVEKLFADAGVSFPPKELLLRAFKSEKELEVWASSERGAEMKRVTTYGICRMSGGIGPKRREGDMQVPEGFYRIEYFWPDPSFWLSAKVSYPNPLDKQLGGGAPGGEIMIHGDCASIGCISLSDERMEELWVMGQSVVRQSAVVHVHIFPSRELDKLSKEPGPHRDFWDNLRSVHEHFEQSRRLPQVVVGLRGKYEIR